jgi:hypothetical protein
MIEATVWLTKLFLSHLVTDFLLQPKSWVEERTSRHFASPKLYLHGFITGLLAWVMIGWQYWPIAIVILVTHIIIDGWKSYRKPVFTYFVVDQLLHLAVIAGCWYFTFFNWNDVQAFWQQFHPKLSFWKLSTAFIFLTAPAGIIIGLLTQKWRDKLPEAENLESAGKWIGIVERVIILIFILYNQFSAIGLLIAAKGIIRFNEKDRQEIKTEYLVIGTLMSMAIAIITGLIVKL